MFLSLDGGFDTGDRVVGGRIDRRILLSTAANIVQPREQIGLEAGKLVVADVSDFEPGVGSEELLVHGRFVVHLGVDDSRHLVEHEPQTADQERIEQEHGYWALSSFSRIFTKLYGGHGPVYLNVSLS